MQSLASRASWHSHGASSRIPAKVATLVTPSGAERSISKIRTRGRRLTLPRHPSIVGQAASSHIVVPASWRMRRGGGSFSAAAVQQSKGGGGGCGSFAAGLAVVA